MNPYENFEGTVKPHPNFDPKVDAEDLKKAVESSGTDERAIINVLAKRSNNQRIDIAQAYKFLYQEDLTDRLKYKLCGDFENVIIALMTPLNDFLASEIHKAISDAGTDKDALIEILCSRTNSEILNIKEAYKSLYEEDIEDSIKSGFLMSICKATRSEAAYDEEKAIKTAKTLLSTGVGMRCSRDRFFISLLVNESIPELATAFKEYQKLAGHSIKEDIEEQYFGNLRNAMVATASCIENRPLYFAEKLFMAMKGIGTDDGTLIRIIVSRCELDMVQIKKEYEQKYGKPLAEAIIVASLQKATYCSRSGVSRFRKFRWIFTKQDSQTPKPPSVQKEDTSGDYRRVLAILVDGY